MARIAPAEQPFPPDVESALARIMPPGVEPLSLFTTLARDPRLFKRFLSASLLDPGHLTLRQREIVIDRTTARCGSEYEWGVHVAFFAERAQLDEAQVHATVRDGPDAPCWSDDERVLVAACDELHERNTIGDARWDELASRFSPEAIVEIVMLAGFYHTVSFLTNALRLAPEPFAARFPDAAQRTTTEMPASWDDRLLPLLTDDWQSADALAVRLHAKHFTVLARLKDLLRRNLVERRIVQNAAGRQHAGRPLQQAEFRRVQLGRSS